MTIMPRGFPPAIEYAKKSEHFPHSGLVLAFLYENEI